MSLHTMRTHPTPVDGCFGCKASTLEMTMPTGIVGRERSLRRDMDAYRRLRAEGLQPPSIKGSAVNEARAAERWDVEHPDKRGVKDTQVREMVDWAQTVVAS